MRRHGKRQARGDLFLNTHGSGPPEGWIGPYFTETTAGLPVTPPTVIATG